MTHPTLEMLHVLEYFIPVVFILFTHFIDEKIHKHWENANYHPNKTIRLINRYQWEICFLVISILLIFGINVALRDKENYVIYGITIIFISVLFIAILFGLAIYILDDEEQKMNASAFYFSIFVYLLYISSDIYLQNISLNLIIFNLIFKREMVFVTALGFFIIIIFFLKKNVDKKLFTVLLSDDDNDYNIKIFENESISRAKRGEALFYIIRYYSKNRNTIKVQEWLKKGEIDFPKKILSIKRVLNL